MKLWPNVIYVIQLIIVRLTVRSLSEVTCLFNEIVLCQKNNELKSLLSETWNSAFLGLLFVSQFQETVAMVAKQQNGEILIDLIYLATCLSAAAVIPNKNPETIVKNIFEKWLSLYVEPQKFLTDSR